MATDSGTNSPDPLSAITGITSLLGLGAKIAGTAGSVGVSQQMAQLGVQEGQLGMQQAAIGGAQAQAGLAYSQRQVGLETTKTQEELQIEAKKRQYMELTAGRQSMENLRNVQKAAAMGKAASVNQGAQFTSGAGGGQSQVAAEGAWQGLGLSQSLQMGEETFDINALISQNKIDQANAKLGYQTQVAGFQTSLTGIQSQQSMIKSQESILKGQQATYSGVSSIGGDIMSAAPSIAKLATTLGPLLLL